MKPSLSKVIQKAGFTRSRLTPESWFCILSFGGFFFTSGASPNAIPLYLLATYTLANPRKFINSFLDEADSALFKITLILIGYWCLSVFWSSAVSPEAAMRTILHGLLLVNLFLAFVIASDTWKRFPIFLCKTVVGAAVVSAVASLLSLGPEILVAGRLQGLGRLENPVVAGIMYGFALTIVLCLLKFTSNKLNRYFWLFIALLLFVSVVLTETRLALLAIFGACLFLFVYPIRALRFGLLFCIFVAFLGVGAISLFITDTPSPLVQRVWDSGNSMPLNSNSQLDNLDGTNRPAGIKAVYHSYGNEIQSVDGIMTIVHATEPALAAGWSALPVEPGKLYTAKLVLRSDQRSMRGLFVRVHERSDLPSGATHIANNPGHKEIGVADEQSHTALALDRPVPANWTTYYFTYVPAEDVFWASLVVSNWVGNGLNPLLIDEVSIYENDSLFAAVSNWLTKRVWISKGFSQRDWIWSESIDRAAKQNILLGLGYSGSEDIGRKMGKKIEHPHSVFVSQFHYGGIIGVLFLAALIFEAIRCARLRLSIESTIASACLCFACVAFAFDGGRLVEKINMVWLVFWLPIMLLIQQCKSNHTHR
jgi:hypothetical protein